MSLTKRGHTGAIVTVEGGAIQHDERSRKRFYNPIIMATCETKAAADLIDKFLMSDRHTSGATATFKRYYLVVYYALNIHEFWTNPSDARISYLPGIVTDWHIRWEESEVLTRNVRLNFKSVF